MYTLTCGPRFGSLSMRQWLLLELAGLRPGGLPEAKSQPFSTGIGINVKYRVG